MAQRSNMRASDADREQIADRLRHATAEGRLLAHELEERMARALRARTYGELDAVVADLPGAPHQAVRRRGDTAQWVRPAMAVAVAIPLAFIFATIVLAAAVFVMTGVFSMWVLWLAVGWFILGRHRHHGPHRGAPMRYGSRRPGPNFWR